MRKLSSIKMWVLLPIGVFLLGFVSARDVQILDKEIDKIYSELSVLRKHNTSLENKISALTDENQKLRAELLSRLENLQTEIRSLSTNVEEYKDYFKKPSQEIGRVKEDVEVRLKGLEGERKSLEEKNRAQEEKINELEARLKGLEGRTKQADLAKSIPAKEVLPEVKRLPAGVDGLYEDAYGTFQRGDFEGARRKFEAFLKQYPSVKLSGNAQFWIGETYYQKKDFEKAILEYEKAISKYPESSKISAALFKQALSFLEVGDKTNARNLLKRVIERFPQSEQSEIAKKKLETIK